jgi:ribonuclease HIII
MTTLGHVLLHVYDYPLGATLYFQEMEKYEADTLCIVADEFNETQHKLNIQNGFENWLNLSVVSDVCDEATETGSILIDAFNENLEKDGWLRQNINFIENESCDSELESDV